MKLLLLSGLGPSFYNEDLLEHSLFDSHTALQVADKHYGGVTLDRLSFASSGRQHPLLRPLPGRGGAQGISSDALLNQPAPHLTTWTLESILTAAELTYEAVDLSTVWLERPAPSCDADIVLLSTTFIWHHSSLSSALRWIAKYLPESQLVLGGQYSNLKYAPIMRDHPIVRCVVRGDGELALPRVVAALRGKGELSQIPNLIYRAPGERRLTVNPVQYVDLDEHPSPSLAGHHPIIPYESMRGCPFSCRFCSFPHASPKWRYKSAMKIRDDWARYADANGTLHVRAYDSTFPTPPSRLRDLLALLPTVSVGWEAFARANAIKSTETIDHLVAAHCRMLTFGFESMSPHTLQLMHKQVRAEENRRAFELLQAGSLAYRASFMVGYPGETPSDFAVTADFMTHDYEGHFLLNVFSLMDETMPVWDNAERLGLVLDDPNDPDAGWHHDGMDLYTARSLMRETLDAIRWNNDSAVHLLWQQRYERPLIPNYTTRENLRIEKLVERLAMASTHRRSHSNIESLIADLFNQLAHEGVHVLPGNPQPSGDSQGATAP